MVENEGKGQERDLERGRRGKELYLLYIHNRVDTGCHAPFAAP